MEKRSRWLAVPEAGGASAGGQCQPIPSCFLPPPTRLGALLTGAPTVPCHTRAQPCTLRHSLRTEGSPSGWWGRGSEGPLLTQAPKSLPWTPNSEQQRKSRAGVGGSGPSAVGNLQDHGDHHEGNSRPQLTCTRAQMRWGEPLSLGGAAALTHWRNQAGVGAQGTVCIPVPRRRFPTFPQAWLRAHVWL